MANKPPDIKELLERGIAWVVLAIVLAGVIGVITFAQWVEERIQVQVESEVARLVDPNMRGPKDDRGERGEQGPQGPRGYPGENTVFDPDSLRHTKCDWVKVQDSHQPTNWCPDGSFITGLDLDGGGYGSRAEGDYPIIAKALCCKLGL